MSICKSSVCFILVLIILGILFSKGYSKDNNRCNEIVAASSSDSSEFLLPPGNHSIKFNANNLAVGVYFYSIKVGDFSAIKKINIT